MHNVGRSAPFVGSKTVARIDSTAYGNEQGVAKPVVILAMAEREDTSILRRSLQDRQYEVLSLDTIQKLDEYLSSDADLTLAAIVVDVELPVGPNADIDTENLASLISSPLGHAALLAAAPEAKPKVWVPRRVDVVRGIHDPNINEEPLVVRWLRELSRDCGQIPLIMVLPSDEPVEGSSSREIALQLHKQSLLREACASLNTLSVWDVPLSTEVLDDFFQDLVTVHSEQQEHLWELAGHYGIDPDRESELLWLAEIIMHTPLPPGWQQFCQVDDEGSRTDYFYDQA
eukprot:SAG31_NODE_7700_length_1613_cov_2.852048_2_plen_286_part_01